MRRASKLRMPKWSMYKVRMPPAGHRYTKKNPMLNFSRDLKAAEKEFRGKFELQYGRKPTINEERGLINNVLEGGTRRRQRKQRGTRRR